MPRFPCDLLGSTLGFPGGDTAETWFCGRLQREASVHAANRLEATVDTDRVEGKSKELEGEAQQKWADVKDKTKDTLEDVKDKGEDVLDKAEDLWDERDEQDDVAETSSR
jgi:hypothetical protein